MEGSSKGKKAVHDGLQSKPLPDASSFPQHSKELQRIMHARHYQSTAKPQRTKTDLDVLKEKHRFIRQENRDPNRQLSWEDELAERWYSRLFREYALVDLKHFKSGQIAMRWRTEDEVLEELGEKTCASLRCEHHPPATEDDLERYRRYKDRRETAKRPTRDKFVDGRSFIELEPEAADDETLVCAELEPYQLNFAYEEDDQPMQALVKVVLCSRCARKLAKGRQAAKEVQ